MELPHQIDLHGQIPWPHRDDGRPQLPEGFIQHEGKGSEMIGKRVENNVSFSYPTGIEGLGPADILIVPFSRLKHRPRGHVNSSQSFL